MDILSIIEFDEEKSDKNVELAILIESICISIAPRPSGDSNEASGRSLIAIKSLDFKFEENILGLKIDRNLLYYSKSQSNIDKMFRSFLHFEEEIASNDCYY